MLPANSEHNALFQALAAGSREELVRVIITASGGPFRTWAAERHRAGDAGAGAETSELVHGPEDHDQFGVDDEQGPRSHRGLLSVRARAPTRSTCSCIRNRSSTAWSNSPTAPWLRSLARPTCGSRSRIAWLAGPHRRPGRRGWTSRKIGQLTFEAPDFERFPALAARLGGAARRVGRDHGAQCRQRGGRWRHSSPARSGSAHCGLVEATMNDWVRRGAPGAR